MEEFDITLNNIKLHVICEKYKKELIAELMNGHSFIEQSNNKPTYNLILRDSLSKNTKGQYIKMIDKWFDNAVCDVWIDNSSKTIYMGNIQVSDNKWKDLLIQYFTVNVFNRLLEEIGFISFHSSCVEQNGIGVAFIAPRNNGKTNCMLNMMNYGYNSVTNDKLAIMYDGKDLIGYGVAQDVSIRISPSFKIQEQNKKYMKYVMEQNVSLVNQNLLEENKIHLDSTMVAKINNVNQVPITTIKKIFYPNYNGNIKQAIFESLSLSELKQLLKEQSLPLVHDTTCFLKEIRTNNSPLYDYNYTFNKILELDAYKVIQGEYTNDSFVDQVNKILKKN